MNEFKRCPVQPIPGQGVLCQSCQHCIIIEPCQTQHKEIPVCIPLYKPVKKLIVSVWQEIYPVLERTTPGGKPIKNHLLKENYLDIQFQECCNLYIDELAEQAKI